MICKLSQEHLRVPDTANMRFICMNTTGEYFLAQADNLPEDITAESPHNDSEESTLVALTEWQQPQPE